jgi:hypothetical protein
MLNTIFIKRMISKEKTKWKLIPVLTLIVGLILGSFVILLSDYRLGRISTDEAGKKAKTLYELTFGGNVDVISTTEENGMYKVIIKVIDYLGRTSMLEVYMSQDGKLVSDRVFKLDEFTTSLEKQKLFIDCLDKEGLKIYGVSNSNVTALLLQQILGGSRFLDKIYVDCDVNLQECLDAKVKVAPSIVYQKEVYEGAKTIEWFENKTGCKF